MVLGIFKIITIYTEYSLQILIYSSTIAKRVLSTIQAGTHSNMALRILKWIILNVPFWYLIKWQFWLMNIEGWNHKLWAFYYCNRSCWKRLMSLGEDISSSSLDLTQFVSSNIEWIVSVEFVAYANNEDKLRIWVLVT